MSTTTRVVRRLQAGFTLIELMVVMVIVGILASIGANIYSGHMRQANVSRAIPYLQNIAAKQRIHYNRTGKYINSEDENIIQAKLGVNLIDAADFCFITVCTDTTSGHCGKYDTTTAVLSDDPAKTAVAAVPAGGSSTFQVIAVLRNSGGTGGVACTVATNKLPPSGWVGSDGAKGAAGRTAIMNYPPVNGTRDTATVYSHSGFALDWSDGVTLSDALVD